MFFLCCRILRVHRLCDLCLSQVCCSLRVLCKRRTDGSMCLRWAPLFPQEVAHQLMHMMAAKGGSGEQKGSHRERWEHCRKVQWSQPTIWITCDIKLVRLLPPHIIRYKLQRGRPWSSTLLFISSVVSARLNWWENSTPQTEMWLNWCDFSNNVSLFASPQGILNDETVGIFRDGGTLRLRPSAVVHCLQTPFAGSLPSLAPGTTHFLGRWRAAIVSALATNPECRASLQRLSLDGLRLDWESLVEDTGTGVGFSLLQGLRNLQLANTDLSDAALADVCSRPHLESVEISCSGVPTLTPLLGCKNTLRYLIAHHLQRLDMPPSSLMLDVRPRPATRSQASPLFRWPRHWGWRRRWRREWGRLFGGGSWCATITGFVRYLGAEEDLWRLLRWRADWSSWACWPLETAPVRSCAQRET